jgi:hypothetical protein
VNRLSGIVSCQPGTQIGRFANVMPVSGVNALDQVDIVHHRKNGETAPDLSANNGVSPFQGEMPAFADYGPQPPGWRSQP